MPSLTVTGFSLPEESAVDTIVGVLSAIDEDGDALTFSIVNNDDNDFDGNDAFRIEGSNLVVNDADDLDFESGPVRPIAIRVSDGELASTSPVVVYLSDVDDAPVITLPANAEVNEGSDLVFSSAGDNAISVSDPDALYTTTMWMQLSVGQGTLTLPSTNGLAMSGGNGETEIEFTGYLTAINEALDGLVYQPTADYSGLDTLTVQVSDESDAQSDDPDNISGSIAITITETIDAPSISLPGEIVVLQDSAPQNVSFEIISDVAMAPGELELSLEVDNPALVASPATCLPSKTTDLRALQWILLFAPRR